jgi:hypothetical protein
MQMHNRRMLYPSRDEVSDLTKVKYPNPPELPADVVETLRWVRDFLGRYAWRLEDEMYESVWNRIGLAADCGCYADNIDSLLGRYGYTAPFRPDDVWE